MASWTIYGSNNVAKAVVKELELHDEWMAECYLTISVKSATPIAFAVGDYIDYRGERYTIQYDPNVLKKATSGSYGEGFTYDNIKFVGLQDEVVRCDFNDIVLNDNDIHYTALPTFPFYCESVDDLLDRIQANLEDLYPGQWIIIGLNTVRNTQRGTAVGRALAFTDAYKQYIDPTGAANTDPYGKQGVAETADNITCWDAMKKVHDDFDLNFIVRGRVIVVGTAGVFTANTFQYGKGNGLYEIERIGESDQRIVTRLRAYGSEENLPAHYYNTINKQVYATITSILHKFDGNIGADFLLDLDFDRKYFTYRSESYPGTTEAPNYIIEMMANDVTVRGYVTKDATTGKCYVYCESVAGDDDRDEPDASKMAAFVQALTANDRLDFVEYVNKDAFGTGHYDYGTGHLPDNMAVSRLMLPGFPTMSLHAWVQAHKDDADKAWLAQAVADGFTFSNEVYRPYIDSPNKTQYGVRPGSIYFDGSDDTEDVHPTIEGMTYNGAPIDEVYAADQVADNGVYPAGEEVKNIKITLPVLGFELDKVYEDGASIDMKNGMCGARSFKMAGTPKKDANGRWLCTVERVHDDALNLWFPYCDFQIHGSSEAGRQHGDNYVLSGIDMPDAYIAAASVRLLQESIEALKKNHAPRYTYQPRIDELWMQRQHDTATASQGVASLHDTLKAGDVFAFADTDLNIDANIIIDVLTIRENGNNGIPTYEVTLRDEKQVGTIQKITNKVDSIVSGAVSINGATGGGLTARQIQSLIDRYGGEQFLSKLNDDTAQGYIKMLQGLQIGNDFASGILGEGGVLRKRESDCKVELEVDILYARMKAYFDTVEIREYQHTGGNRIASVAGNKICRVAWFNSSNVELEQTQTNLANVAYFRCYFRASDGEDTVRNNWVVGDLAYCHVTSITNSSDNPEQKGLNQKHLWRLVIGRNTEGTLTEDGEAYIDLSNRATETISGTSYTGYQSGSDIPASQDDIIQLGNVNDTTRQGAIVEFVTGTDAPSYQIFQNINSFSLSGKNQIGFGYNTSTGKAYLRVLGDAYIGARDRSTYIEYKQGDGTAQNPPQLNIKAVMQTLPSSTYEGKSASQFVQENQIKYDDDIDGLLDAVGGLESDISGLEGVTQSLQRQIDGAIDTWYYDYMPVQESQGAPANRIPLTNVEPYKSWYQADGGGTASEVTTERTRHLDDIFYDNSTGYAFRFSLNSTTGAFEWVVITDSAVLEALERASKAQETADGKRTVYSVWGAWMKSNVNTLEVGDLFIPTADTTQGGVTYKAKKVYKCTTEGSATFEEIAYTDDSAFNGYISAFLNGSGASGDSATAAAIQKAITTALGSALGSATLFSGGLMLTSLIGMRQLNSGGDPSQISDYTTWGGISGEYNPNDETVSGGAKGHGIAAWYGGDMVDKEMLSDEDIAAGWGATLPDESTNYRWARSLFRFDGSGYIADANIYWNKEGSMVIKNLQTIYGTQAGASIDINTLSSLSSIFNTETYASGANNELLVKPTKAFSRLYLNRTGTPVTNYPSDGSINDYAVLNFSELKARFITKEWFNQFFVAHYKQNNVDKTLSPNEGFPDDATDKTLESVFSFWTNYGLTALGRGVSGSQVVSVLDDLNDVTITNPQTDQVLKYNGTKWVNAAAPSGASALSGLTDVGISSLADKDILQYDYTNNVWKNVTLATALTGYATTSQLSSYLPLSGGTLSGNLLVSADKGANIGSSSARFYYSYLYRILGLASISASTDGTNVLTLPSKTGTIAVTSDIPSLSGYATESWVGNNYLPLSGGTLRTTQNTDIPLNLRSGGTQPDCYLGFFNYAGTLLGYIGYNTQAKPILYDTGTEYEIWHKGNLTDNTQLSNGAGYITGITSSMITTALGYTPANSSSLSSYLPLSGGNMSGRIYFTQNGTGSLGVDSMGIYIQTGSHWLRAGTGGCDCDGYAIIHAGNIASQSVASAAQLTTSRTIWGQSFNGAGNVDGIFTLDKASFSSTEYVMKIKHGSYDCNGAQYDSLVIAAQDAATIRMQDGGEQSQLGICIDGNVAHYTSTGEFKFYAGGTKNTAVWSGMGGTNILRLTSTDAYINGNLSPSNLFVINNSSNSAYDSMVYLENKSNSDWAMHINCSGYSYGLQIQAQNNPYGLYALCGAHISGSVGIGTTTLSYKLNVDGDIYATGGVTSLSDIRKKDVISYELPLSVEQIAAAPTIRFTWIDKREEGEQVGTIAQYWEKVLPQVCKDKSGELSMGYGVTALIAATIDARKIVDHDRLLREQAAKISELEEKCSFLEREVERLKCA